MTPSFYEDCIRMAVRIRTPLEILAKPRFATSDLDGVATGERAELHWAEGES